MANPTSNFNWQMPTPTDLVTDLPADFEVFGQAVDSSMADLLGGTTGQILAKNSNTNMDFVWITNDVGDITAVTAGTGISGGGTSGSVTITNSMATEIAAKGDLIVGTGSATFDNLAAGANGQVLTADSTAATGLAYTTPNGPAFRAYRATSNQTFSQNTWTKVQLNAETFDTATCFDSTTNYRFTPNKAGYYQFNGAPWNERSGTGLIYAGIWKNGAEAALTAVNTATTTQALMASDVIYMNGTTDYVELYIYDQAATSREIAFSGGGNLSYFSGTWIRS